MSRSKIIFFTCCLFLNISLAGAQQLRTIVDWAIFDYDAENVYVELYYSFMQADLHYEQAEDSLRGLTLGQVAFMQGDNVVVSNAWKSEMLIADSTVLQQSKDIIDRVAVMVPFGDYTCQLVIKDLVHIENVDTVTWALNISAPKLDETRMSDIEVASSIRRAEEEDKSSPFYKNSLIVEPNPALLYSYEHPALFFYTEAYNLPVESLPQGYRVKYYVVDSDGTIPDGVTPKAVKKKKALQSSVEFGMLNVGNLATGAYTFKVELQNTELLTIAEQSKKIYVLQKEDAQKQQATQQGTPYESSLFVIMDSSAVEKEYLMVFYLLSKEEQVVHKEIVGMEQRRHFLYNFWNNKYPETNVNDNPMRTEYFRRARAADDRFAAFKLEGWLTDRGRVSMVYGEPDDIDRHPNEPNKYEYEIWFYNSLQSGASFVFVDFEGHGNYRLIHSNLLGEIQDYNYSQTLKKTGF